MKSNVNIAKIYQKWGILIVLIIMAVICAIMNPIFIKPTNITNIFKQVVVVGIIACGENLVMLTGDIDLAPGSVVALSGVYAASIVTVTGSPALAIFVGVLAGAICGFISGAGTVAFGIPSFIMTLAMQSIVRGMALIFTNGVPISNLGDLTVIGQASVGPIPIPIFIFIAIVLITAFITNKTRTGRYLYAVGGNRAAAKASGINDKKVRLLAFVWAGITAGLAGVILAARSNSGQAVAGEGYEFDAVTAVVIGGTSMSGGVGKISGTFFGALLVGVLENIMNLQGVSSYYQQIVKGAIIAIAVIVDVKVRAASEK